MSKQIKKIYRDIENARVSGVCAGLSDYLDVDVMLVRVVFLIVILAGGIGLIAYIVMAIMIEPKDVVLDRMEREREKTVVDQDDDDPFSDYY